MDTTRRYTANWASVLERRKLCSEDWLEKYLQDLRRQLASQALSAEEFSNLKHAQAKEFEELLALSRPMQAQPEELVGRRTGDAEWHAQRGEKTFKE